MTPANLLDRLIIFDGVCNLCNTFVDFTIRQDPSHKLKFASNQSQAGREILQHFGVIEGSEEANTVYFLENGQLYEKSTAALRVARHLRFPWNLGIVFQIFPRFLRDSIYEFIARNRYKWFGKKSTCRLPGPEERALFVEKVDL
ncbi:MAG: thiol-disulfide oxidoreductase DCC family protein [Bacteroidota bacterium]